MQDDGVMSHDTLIRKLREYVQHRPECACSARRWIAGDEYICTCDLASLLSEGSLEQSKEQEENTRVDGSKVTPRQRATASNGLALPLDDDWRRFCVNHEGYSGPTSVCPTCQRRG